MRIDKSPKTAVYHLKRWAFRGTGGILLICGLTACETVPDSPYWVKDTASFREFTSLEVERVVDATGKNHEFDVSGRLTEYIRSGLTAKGINVVSEVEPEDQRVLLVRSTLVAYSPGSAVARWMAPGAGKTQCSLQTTLIKKSTNEKLADVISAPEVGGGGLFSLGAEKWILKVCASEIVEKIAEIMGAPRKR